MPKCKSCGAPTLCFPPCEFCQDYFCSSHMLPEVHGCDLACKNAARANAFAAAREQHQARKHVGNDAALDALHKRLEEGEAARRKKGNNKKK